MLDIIPRVLTDTQTPGLSKTRADFMKSLLQFDHRHILKQIPLPLAGTCHWMTEHSEFRRWQQMRSSSELDSESCRICYIYGSPGVGKTVMSRYLRSYLHGWLEHYPNDGPVLVYFFCDNKDLQRQTSLSLIRSLLVQILLIDKKLLQHIPEDRMQSHIENLKDHSIKTNESIDLWDMLILIVERSRRKQFWFIIDALDELDPSSRREVIRQINRALEADIVGRLRVLFTDRQEPRHDFENPAVIELGAHESQDDVRHLIRQKIEELCEEVAIEKKYRDAIENEISMMANGTFLHATLAFANFTRGVTDWSPRVVKSRLNDLRALPDNVESYYAGLLRQIPQDFRQKARRAFIWVLGSTTRKQLTVQELHHAVSINGSQRSWEDLKDDLSFNFHDSFQASCGYLLKIADDDLVVFAHQTVKELFEKAAPAAREVDEQIIKYFRISPEDVDREIVTSCLNLLQYREFDEDNVERSLLSKREMVIMAEKSAEYLHTDGFSNFRQAMDGFPLLAYAVHFWYHLDCPSSEPHLANALYTFLTSPYANYFRFADSLLHLEARRAVGATDGLLSANLPSLHHCVRSGDFPQTTRLILQSGADPNVIDAEGMTAFHRACTERRVQSVKVLLDGASLNVNKAQRTGLKPIHTALNLSREWQRDAESNDILLLLLNDARVDVNATAVGLRLYDVPCRKLIQSSMTRVPHST